MSFKPVFIDKSTVDNAKKNIYKIHIGSSLGPVTGFLTSEFQVRSDAKWEPALSFDGMFGSAQKMLQMGGYGLFNTGLWSQLMFKNGGYLILTPEFRIVDWNEDEYKKSPTLRAAEILTTCCYPRGGNSNSFKAGGGSTVKELAAAASSVVADAREGVEGMGEQFGSFFQKLVTGVTGKNPKDSVSNTVGAVDFSKILSNSPPPVSIRVGNFYYFPEMVVEAADCKFSKEMTRRGPLYVDIKLELKSLQRPNSSGFRDPTAQNRVFSDRNRAANQ